MSGFVKERVPAVAGSIPALLDMWEREARFYEQIADVVGVRVPALYQVTRSDAYMRLTLEDLSHWRGNVDPVAAARVLKNLHCQWVGTAEVNWPWLRRAGDRAEQAANAIGNLYDQVWNSMTDRADLTPTLLQVGNSLVGKVAELERAEAHAPQRVAEERRIAPDHLLEPVC